MHSENVALVAWKKEHYALWGLCECCGQPLHTEKEKRHRRINRQKPRGVTTPQRSMVNKTRENVALSSNIDAILKWIDGSDEKPNPQRFALNDKARQSDAVELEIKKFAKTLRAQRCLLQKRITLCPEGKSKIVEFCKRREKCPIML